MKPPCCNLSQLWPLLQYKQDAATEGNNMATTSVRLDKDLVDKATIMAKALNRSPPKQIEHWAKIGEIMEDNPDLPYEFVRQSIIAEAEREAGKLERYDFG
jgi:hypothetical protein